MSRKALIDCDNVSLAFNSDIPQYFHTILGKSLCEYVVSSVLGSVIEECYVKAIENVNYADKLFGDNSRIKILRTQQEFDALRGSGESIIGFYGDAPLYDSAHINRSLENLEEEKSFAFDSEFEIENPRVLTRVDLAKVTKQIQQYINEGLMSAGVSMTDPDLVWIGPDVEIAQDTVIEPLTFIFGNSKIGKNCMIGPNSRITDTEIADDCVFEESIAHEAKLEAGSTCGPRAYLRPGAHLLSNAKAGTHVEIKNSTIGKGSKVPHLSYIGDTVMGEGVNIGAGSITCNYDGAHKSKTTIGDDVFVGSSTMMVAPVSIGDDALIAAGSVITEDVKGGSLGIGRARQVEKKGWCAENKPRKNK
ncbi:MAG: hypothetical protein HUJ51_06715 [Eggerthellaceae bacterium]|nr:hypothetical protein [Eggerthellaceae bacterium]